MPPAVNLPRALANEIARRASRAGVSVEEYLADLVYGSMDPDAAASKYLETTLNLLEQAREELGRGDLRQASEKIWGSCALAIKAYALAREGRRLGSHAELWVYKNRVAEELGSWVRIAFKIADSMHKNFYEGLATREDVEDAIKEVGKLVEAIAEKLRHANPSP
ncbi:PaREP1 family protein [Stetteria hydrogenophila]